MLKIDLKDLYPHRRKRIVKGGKLIWVKVPNPSCVVEVYAEEREAFLSEMTRKNANILFGFQRKENAFLRKMFRYGMKYSLDAGDGIEKDVLIPAPTPHGVFFEKLKRERLHAALDSLPKKTSWRIKAHFYDGLSVSQIARAEGAAKSTVSESITFGLEAARNYIKKLS